MQLRARINWGCHTCRAKRIKCDRSRPHCQRCLKADRCCPGYRDESEAMFRNMNVIAETQVKARFKDRGLSRDHLETEGKRPADSIPGSIAAASSKAPLSSTSTPTSLVVPNIMPRSMSIKWQDIAVPRFFEDYIFCSDLVSRSCLDFLLEIGSASGSCAAFNEALDAVALRSLGNQLGLASLSYKASKSYSRSVQLFRDLLHNEDDAKKDSTLAVVVLFTLYEGISGVSLNNTIYDSCHYAGLTSILRLRGKTQFKTEAQRSLFRVSYATLTYMCVGCNAHHAQESLTWLELLGTADPQQTLGRCNTRAVQLFINAQSHFDENTHDISSTIKLLQFIKEAILIDLEHQQWSDSTEGNWRYKILRTPSDKAPPPDYQMFPKHLYHDIHVAYLWNRYRSFRIRLHEVLIHCISLVERHPHSESAASGFGATLSQSKIVISDMIFGICASIPFCLGTIDSTGKPLEMARRVPISGYLSLWPLYIAMVSAEQDSYTKAWIQENLEYISCAMGIEAGRMLANRQRKQPWDIR